MRSNYSVVPRTERYRERLYRIQVFILSSTTFLSSLDSKLKAGYNTGLILPNISMKFLEMTCSAHDYLY
jgi:hypothetical protein